MLETIDEKRKRDELLAQRNSLFERLLESPADIRLALEIKTIDDQVAECTKQLHAKKAKRN